jgi:glycosyltransferase involved in cell wall biosynthesis
MGANSIGQKLRLAIVVSHPIQYYVPLYRRLAIRDDLEPRVFYTWHAAADSHSDYGFKREFKWDIPLTEGYNFEPVPNKARFPGTHHFWGLRNPELVGRVLTWKPDAVHITGYAFASHLNAIRQFHSRGVAVLFRGDSHLLDQQPGIRWQLKRFLLGRIYRRVCACLYVGKNNYDYYRNVGVPDFRLFYCPHSIDVERFSEPNEELEAKAKSWRRELRIPPAARVILFAGKFENKKRPLELMQAVAGMKNPHLVLVMIGNGMLEKEINSFAAQYPEKFRVLPFQNQSQMPLVYRLGDIFTLPSSFGETWGLAVNEALASGRRVLISDKVGCSPDLVKSVEDGEVFATDDWNDFEVKLRKLLSQRSDSPGLRQRAKDFDIPETEAALVATLAGVREQTSHVRFEKLRSQKSDL